MAEWIVEIGDGNPNIKKMTELVRCRDCKWLRLYEEDTEPICAYWDGYNTDLDGFCYMGEKTT